MEGAHSCHALKLAVRRFVACTAAKGFDPQLRTCAGGIGGNEFVFTRGIMIEGS